MDGRRVAPVRATEGSRQQTAPISGRGVWVVGGDPVLSAAVTAGLSVTGWAADRPSGDQRRLPDHPRDGAAASLVLLADGGGNLPDIASLGGVPRAIVAVGDRSCTTGLVRALQHGAVAAIDADRPVGALVRSIDRCLTHPPRGDHATSQAVLLREQGRTAALFAKLSEREQDVLGALVRGLSAAEIAAERHLSIATVRTHIRAILTQLGVSSQIAAVAMTHRYCREAGVLRGIANFTNFDGPMP